MPGQIPNEVLKDLRGPRVRSGFLLTREEAEEEESNYHFSAKGLMDCLCLPVTDGRQAKLCIHAPSVVLLWGEETQ